MHLPPIVSPYIKQTRSRAPESRFTITFQQLGENVVINGLICRAVVKWDHLLGGPKLLFIWFRSTQQTHGLSVECVSSVARMPFQWCCARMQSKSCLHYCQIKYIWHSLCFVEVRRRGRDRPRSFLAPSQMRSLLYHLCALHCLVFCESAPAASSLSYEIVTQQLWLLAIINHGRPFGAG